MLLQIISIVPHSSIIRCNSLACLLFFSGLFHIVQAKSHSQEHQQGSEVVVMTPDKQINDSVFTATNFQFVSKRKNGPWKPFRGFVKQSSLDTLKVSFLLEGNAEVSRSTRRLYLVIQDPYGNTIEEIGQFKLKGEPVPYTNYMDAEYIPDQVNECTFEVWIENKKNLAKGKYAVRIYDQEIEIGQIRIFIF